jgi:hypothetical protein
LSPVKSPKRSRRGPLADRLAILLDAFSPWAGISLTYKQFAAEIGAPLTEAAVKKWPQRERVPPEVARLIVAKARQRGLSDVTLEWVLWGDGPGPQRAQNGAQNRGVARRPPSPSPTAQRDRVALATAPQEPHGRFAAGIAEALQADLSHNEFGQWSSAEVQHTVIWALKDLARRLRALRFDMGKTFELTDDWAGKVGLPIRSPEGPSDERGPDIP